MTDRIRDDEFSLLFVCTFFPTSVFFPTFFPTFSECRENALFPFPIALGSLVLTDEALPHTVARKHVEPMFFWKGDTNNSGDYEASDMNDHQSTMRKKNEGSDGNHIPTHGAEGAGSKHSGSNPEWLVVNHAKKKWASVWRPITTNSMSLEVSTTNPMYTTVVAELNMRKRTRSETS